MSIEELSLEEYDAKEKLLNKMRSEGIPEKDMNFVDKEFGKIIAITNLATQAQLDLLRRTIMTVAEREGMYMANQVGGGTVVNFVGSFLRATYRDSEISGDEMVMLLDTCIQHEKGLKGNDAVLKPIVKNPMFKGIDERSEGHSIPGDWKEEKLFKLEEKK